jgi:hypothetical protein
MFVVQRTIRRQEGRSVPRAVNRVKTRYHVHRFNGTGTSRLATFSKAIRQRAEGVLAN